MNRSCQLAVVNALLPPPQRIARFGVCDRCSRPIRHVQWDSRMVWVDELPVPSGRLVINGDRVIGVTSGKDRTDGFSPHLCGALS